MPLVEFCDWCTEDADLECRDCGSRWCAAHAEDHDKEHAQRANECPDCGFELCVCNELVPAPDEVEVDVDSARDWTMPERWGV